VDCTGEVGGCTSSPEVWACQASSVAAISTAIALLLTLNEQGNDALRATQLLSTPSRRQDEQVHVHSQVSHVLNVTCNVVMKLGNSAEFGVLNKLDVCNSS
jgi:hypothetical protein